jgi:hypothetical protein
MALLRVPYPRRRHCLTLALLATMVPAWGSAADEPGVAAIESAYLTKFPAFVEWPARQASPAPPTLCVIGNDEIARLSERVLVGKTGQAVAAPVIRQLAPGTAPKGCQILFLGDTPAAATANSLAEAAGEPILVVTDQASDGDKGIINFVILDDRVRFEIDDQAAARRGLVISSKLLSLAVAVKPRAS